MMLRFIGCILIIFSCTGFGLLLASSYKKEELMLRQLEDALGFMENNLRCSIPDLPELCFMTAQSSAGSVSQIFLNLAKILEENRYCDAQICVAEAVRSILLPRSVRDLMIQLGKSLGKFDLDGQLAGIRLVLSDCTRLRCAMSDGQDLRIRNYRTLGICAGLALAILLI